MEDQVTNLNAMVLVLWNYKNMTCYFFLEETNGFSLPLPFEKYGIKRERRVPFNEIYL